MIEYPIFLQVPPLLSYLAPQVTTVLLSLSPRSIITPSTYSSFSSTMTSALAGPRNEVFEKALAEHINRWQSDKRSFPRTSTPADILQEAKGYENKHKERWSTRCTTRIAKIVEGFQTYVSAVDTLVSALPKPSGLVWGGLKCVVQVSNGEVFCWL